MTDAKPIDVEVESKALAVIPPPNESPMELIGHAGRVAVACKQIVLRTACNIQGKKYVKVEGWQSIAIAHGCCASSRDVERLESGFRAIGEVRRMSDGILLATAEGFVGFEEKTWGKRDEYAQRAMAQTRAISRACRSAFAHIVVMMEAGLSTTPAEEVPPDGFNDEPAPKPPQTAQKPPAKASPAKASQANGGGSDTPGFAERCKAKFRKAMDGPMGPYAWAWAVNNGVIMDTEVLADGEAAKFPQSLQDFEKATAEMETIRKAWTNHQQEVYEKAVLLHEAESAKKPTKTETGFVIKPKPEQEPWRTMPIPFGKDAGKLMGDLDKKKLWGWWANFKVETEYNGKPKAPGTLARDQQFRAMLDAAGAHYEFKPPEDAKLESSRAAEKSGTDPDEIDVPF